MDPAPVPPPRIHVPDHLARCLIMAVLFPPTGWLAVRHALRVNRRLAVLDLEGARRERRLALRWHRLSALGLLAVLGGLIGWSLRQAFGPAGS